jgi:hypothetical protein
MREQTWYICQATHGLAKGLSRASPSPPRDLDFLRAIYGPSIRLRQKPPAIHYRSQATPSPPSAIEPDTSLIRVVAAAPTTSGGGAGRTGGTTCEENTRTDGDFTRAKKSRAGKKNRSRVRFG